MLPSNIGTMVKAYELSIYYHSEYFVHALLLMGESYLFAYKIGKTGLRKKVTDLDIFRAIKNLKKIMLLILDCNSEHVAHA